MNWNKSRRFTVPARMLAVAMLAIVAWCSPYQASADIGSVLEATPRHTESALPGAPSPGRFIAPEVPTYAPVMLAQASDKKDEKDEKEKKAEKPKGPEPSAFWVVNTLRANPVLAIFLVLAIGYWVGAIKVGNFSLGSVTGVLLAGVLVGQLVIDINPHLRTMFFWLFLFSVGYGVGPQFVRGVATDAGPQALFGAIVCLLCLGSVYACAVFAGYGPGLAAGLLAGSQTISASIGLATDAINNLGIGDRAQQEITYMPVAYAVCYIYGTIGTGWILAFLGPKLLNVDIEAECARYERENSVGAPIGGAGTAWQQLDMRTFKVDPGVVGKTVVEAEATVKPGPVYIESLKRGDEMVEVEPSTVLQDGDVVAVSGPTENLIEQISPIAKEVAEKDMLQVPVETVDLVMTNKAYSGKTVMEIAEEDFARGVFLNKITRGAVSVDIPILAQTEIYRGDILTIAGTKKHTAEVIEAMGYVDRPSSQTDMVWLGIFALIGGLIGAITVKIGEAPITLSVSGGILLAGIVMGWLRSVRPIYGQVPAPSLWFMNSVGLNVFIGAIGISAGPGFVAGLQEAGFTIFFLGVVSTSVPMLLAPLIGKYIFRFDPAINLGCCGGSRTSTASVAMVGEVAKSNVPMLGYTVPYAVGNTLLTLWGLAIVMLIGAGPGG